MKRIGIILLLTMVMPVILAAQQKYYDALAYGLKGNVKMESSLGMTTNWNEDRSFACEKVKRDTRNRVVRIEMSYDGWYTDIKYDANGRLDEIKQITGNQLSQTEKYFYHKADDFLPYKVRITYNDGQSLEQTYKYLETDSHGNWIRRTSQDTGRKPVTSKRTIEYWD